MNTPDSTGSVYVRPVDRQVPNPAFPIPPGGSVPDLSLASWPSQQGASVQPMPDPGKPDPMNYRLVGDPTMGGYEPTNPVPPAPNLAGVDGWPPSPSSLVPVETMFPGVAGSATIAPQYGMPDFSQPDLQTANLADDGISFEPRREFDPDPANPDLTSYNRPRGLLVHNSGLGDLFKPDPVLADLTQPAIPDGVQTVRHPLAPDPLVPDLQNPQLEQSVHMTTRPGELSATALSTMSADPMAQATSSVPYGQSFMDASGMNTTRRRHFDLMMNGLKNEEC